jgi:hypothetical protein
VRFIVGRLGHALGAVLLVGCLAPGVAAAATDDDADKTEKPVAPAPNKLTLAYYDFSSHATGFDINLRHTFSTSTAWIGAYREDTGFNQVRVGYEYDYHRDWLTLVPSVLAATRGFLGASIYAEMGRPFFAIAGSGRTNLRPYWNLGFDPNDYIQFGAGYRDHAGNTMLIYAIRDNRLDTGQTNTHLYFRRYLPDDWRVTVDVVREHGLGDNDLVVRGWATSVDVDWRRWFVRIALDPNVNYRPVRQVRVATGVRF